mgnify:CR=1 FL=1
MTTVIAYQVRTFVALPSDDALAKARADLLAAGFTDAEIETETGMGLRRLPNCPGNAPIFVKFAAGALSLTGVKAAVDMARNVAAKAALR